MCGWKTWKPNRFRPMFAPSGPGYFASLTIIQIEASGFPPKFSKNFRIFFEIFLYKSFVCSFARSFENFSKFSSRRRDRFGPKIVKFRAILAIFRPFEDFEFETAPKRSIWIRFELQGPPKGPAARIEFKCYSLVESETKTPGDFDSDRNDSEEDWEHTHFF